MDKNKKKMFWSRQTVGSRCLKPRHLLVAHSIQSGFLCPGRIDIAFKRVELRQEHIGVHSVLDRFIHFSHRRVFVLLTHLDLGLLGVDLFQKLVCVGRHS